MRTKKTATTKTVTGKNGSFYNLGNGPLSYEAIEKESLNVQKAISTLPEGDEKNTIAHGFANFVGYVKKCDWLRGIAAPEAA